MAPTIHLRRPSFELMKPSQSISSKDAVATTSHTLSRSPSPAESPVMVVKEDEQAFPPAPGLNLHPSEANHVAFPRKKSGHWSCDNFQNSKLMSSFKNSLRRGNTSTSSKQNSSFHLSLDGNSGHGGNSLALSGHGGVSSAAGRELRAFSCDNDPNPTANVAGMVSKGNDAWEQQSDVTSKSKKSCNSVGSSHTGSSVNMRLGRLGAYSNKKRRDVVSNHSSHPSGFAYDMGSTPFDKNVPLPCNSEHNESLSEMFYTACATDFSRRGSISEQSALSITDHEDSSSYDVFQSVFNELDKNLNSEALLAKLSEDASAEELFKVAAVRVSEVIQEASIEDRMNFAAIPQFSKTDVLIGKHLGKGTFSDVFEVTANVQEDSLTTRHLLGQVKSELDQRIQAKFGEDKSNRGSDAFDYLSINKSSLLPQDDQRRNSLEGIESGSEDEVNLEEIVAALEADRSSSAPPPGDVDFLGTAHIARRSSLCSSVCVMSPQTGRRTRRVTLAMKCLRPAIRSNTEQFMIGVEDLVHESVMLSSLIHPNIIKVHGRSKGTFSSNLLLEDGYFILLDRLQDTIDNRIAGWRKKYPNSSKNPPSIYQVKVAAAVADALAFLHEKKIVFRDLKPANVGFDERGVVKLFDFGFAIKLNQPEEGEDGDGLLYDKAGTPRYMAPEVEFGMGYALPADVYSFGILLWEIIALKKPYGKIKSAAEFTKVVFQNGDRPKLGKNWSQELNDLLTECWSSYPNERPSMKKVKRILQTLQGQISSSSERSQRRSILFK